MSKRKRLSIYVVCVIMGTITPIITHIISNIYSNSRPKYEIEVTNRDSLKRVFLKSPSKKNFNAFFHGNITHISYSYSCPSKYDDFIYLLLMTESDSTFNYTVCHHIVDTTKYFSPNQDMKYVGEVIHKLLQK